MHITPLLSSLPSTAQFVGPRGRPPDDLPDVVMPQSHERCSSVSAVVDVAMDDSRPASCLLELQQHNGVPADGSVEWKVSYATMVARNPSNTGKSSASHTFSEDDIVVLEDDYVIAHSGKIPSIKFLNRVHEQIDKSMRNTIIVRLLGRSIGFKTLHARLLAI
ncbi:hypothetical protein V6N12_069605 [Hibiscus sabdariffa]|uniref:Uncharacterized protein n=1 Tax=Hibiscus sabdariffa TaxID=183260 RepID=A0ABR2FEI9_9ROSI